MSVPALLVKISDCASKELTTSRVHVTLDTPVSTVKQVGNNDQFVIYSLFTYYIPV